MQKTILAVLAHPDDESFGMGGTLAKYASEGVKVHLICATRGEAGEVDPDRLIGFDSIADLRTAELNCAVKALGIEPVKLLDYRDSGMAGSEHNHHPGALINAPLEKVAGEVAAYIRKIQPQIVLTFDPVGGYRHPDHIFIHQAATRAVELAGDPDYGSDHPPYQPARLFYHTIPRHFIRFNVSLLRFVGKDPTKYGKNQDIDLTLLAKDDFPVHAQIRYGSHNQAKMAASACHASQGGRGLTRGPIRFLAWLLAGKPADRFMQAYPLPSEGNSRVKKDLFVGIEGI